MNKIYITLTTFLLHRASAIPPSRTPSLQGDGCTPAFHCVCYEEINECYSSNSPWGGTSERPLKKVPESPSAINAEFHLFSQKHKKDYQPLTSLDSSKSTTVFIVHGYISDGDDAGWMGAMKDAILAEHDYNVVLIDWKAGADGGLIDIQYPQSSQNARVVGDVFGSLLIELVASGLDLATVHCVGHSLGAHVCGYGGKYAAARSASKIGRITGLDPAGPYFEHTPEYVRLDKTDAVFVDSIHTDGDALWKGSFGMLQAISHADFYPNGGNKQPGCHAVPWELACSHGKATEYFLQSIITPEAYPATICDDYASFKDGECSCENDGCGLMGWAAKKTVETPTEYYLKTV